MGSICWIFRPAFGHELYGLDGTAEIDELESGPFVLDADVFDDAHW